MKELILNEEKLIKYCIENNRHAQESLYNQYYKELYLIAIRYLSDHHDTEDVIILTFTKVFKSLKSFQYKGQGSLGKWIRTILINESIRLLKKRKELQFEEDLQHLNIQSTSADGLQQMQASDILQMIEKLPSGYRTIFNLYVIEGHSHKEIAELLAISENTSKTQLKKARASLMNRINEEKHMEQSDIDRLIKDKLDQEISIHNHEIEKSKPFVWTAIQKELDQSPKTVKWYYLAAAGIVLLICTSFLFHIMQRNHQAEIQVLAKKVEALQVNYASQAAIINSKDQELLSVCNEVEELEFAFSQFDDQDKVLDQSPRLVYKTDTVFIKQVEFITRIVPSQNVQTDTLKEDIVLETQSKPPINKVDDDIIYPSFANSKQRQTGDDALKFKLSSYTSN